MRHLLLACSVLCVAAASAQEFRLSGGYNGSNVVKAGEEQWTGRAGYQFGADVVLGGKWFLKPGVHLLVRNMNYTLSTGPDIPEEEFQYTSRSLAIPMMLGLHLMDPVGDPPLNIYLLGGPTALMNLNADLDNDELDVETNNTQWYLGFGGGLTFSFLFAEAGYNVAMTNVFDGDAFETNPKVNQVYAIAGVRLRLTE